MDQWRRQLSQQSSYKAEIHELYTEMLNMREKSEMQSHPSAQMCRLETPSRSVESEPENVLNTASPGQSSSWILPNEMMSTPDRPTTSGLQSPTGAPMQFSPSRAAQEHCRQSPCQVHLQLNGEVTLLENPEKKNVKWLATYQLVKSSHSKMIQHRMRRTRMSSIQQQFQVLLMLVHLIYLVQDALMVTSKRWFSLHSISSQDSVCVRRSEIRQGKSTMLWSASRN